MRAPVALLFYIDEPSAEATVAVEALIDELFESVCVFFARPRRAKK